MRRLFALKIILTILCLLVACAAQGAGPAVSKLERFGVYQLGDSDVVMELSGHDVPVPEVLFRGSAAFITLRGTRLNERNGGGDADMAPLILNMTARQTAADTVIEVRTAKPLRLHSRYSGAGTHTLRMTAERSGPTRLPQPAEPGALPSIGINGKAILDNIDIRDIDLSALFRLVAEALGKSVIIDPSMPSATVSLSLKGVPAKDVFDYLMKTYGLSCCQLGENTLVIGTRDGLSRLSGEEETRAFEINYADPASLIKPLSSLTHIPEDRFVADLRLHTIYITSNPRKLDEAVSFIQSMDRPRQQVMIRAKIFEFMDGSSREVETALNAVYGHWWLSYSGQNGATGGYIRDNNIGRGFTGPAPGYPVPGMTDLITPMDGLWREFDAAFRAIEERGRGRTLASPSVITLDGQEAQIKLTEDYPYISARDEAGNPTWSTETIGPQLTLTPKVERGGMIELKISAATGDVIEMITGSTGERMPRTSTRSVTTRIRVRDGEPFVVGGLFRDNTAKRRVGIPVLGQIPLIGELFTYRYDERSRTQAVILVIPYILSTSE